MSRQTSVGSVRFGLWLIALIVSLDAVVQLPRLGLSSPPVDSLASWPAWFAARPVTDGVFGFVRLIALGLGGYLVLVTALALLVRLTGDARAVWIASRFAVPGLRPLLFGLASFAVVAAPGTALADSGPAGVPVLVRVADGTVAPPPVLRQAAPDPPPGARPPAPPEPAAPSAVTGPPTRPAGGSDQATIVVGDHLWKVAATALAGSWHRRPTDAEIVPYWLAVIDRNRAALVDPANPDLVFPGQVFQLPPLPDPPPG